MIDLAITAGRTGIPRLIPSITCVVWAVVLVGCERDTAAGPTVTDSAGVQITLSPDVSMNFAEVDPRPLLTLGGPDASGATQFFRIQNIYVDPHGRLWVADGQSSELRIFESDGTHWKTRGRRGEGPGEFLQIRLLGPFSGDSVLVADDPTGRIAVFDPEAEFVRTETLRSGDDPVPRAFDVFHDRSVLGQVPRILRGASTEAVQIIPDTVHLVRVDLQSATREPQATALGPLWLWTGQNQVPIPFTINSSFAVYDESVHLVAGPAFRVRVFQAGRLSEVYGVTRDEREVSQDDITAYRAFTEEYVRESRRSDYLSGLSHPARPTVVPAYSGLIVASDGNVWAQRYSPDFMAPAWWDVFNPARELLGQVQTPAGFITFSITGESLAGVWRDELGVEHVRVYQVRPN